MPPIARLVSEVDSKSLGATKMVSVREHRFPFLHKVGHWNRFNKWTGGTLVEKACHFFDLMRRLVQDDVVSVYASGGGGVNHRDEDYPEGKSDILDFAQSQRGTHSSPRVFKTLVRGTGARGRHVRVGSDVRSRPLHVRRRPADGVGVGRRHQGQGRGAMPRLHLPTHDEIREIPRPWSDASGRRRTERAARRQGGNGRGSSVASLSSLQGGGPRVRGLEEAWRSKSPVTESKIARDTLEEVT